MVRIFSNVSLSWPKVQALKVVAPKHPGYIMNLHLYRLTSSKPILGLHTYSSLNLLHKHRRYQCYNKFGLSNTVIYGNTSYTLFDRTHYVMTIYLPSSMEEGDIIAIEDHLTPKQQEVFLPGLFFPMKEPNAS